MKEKQNSTANNRLKRELSVRHLTMIGIGGSIGTGLFVGLGFNFTSAGPGGALVAYLIMGITVYFMMNSLGEMSAYMPVSGSFAEYCTRFVDPALGFSIGFGYWLSWPIVIGSELVASVMVIRYWIPGINPIVSALIMLALLYALNVLSAKGYGEGEFWFALIKVVTIIIFLILGVLMILGIVGGESPGFDNWTYGEAPFVGGGIGVLTCFLLAGYSFQGTEALGIASGESEEPGKAMPKAIKSVFWRIFLFYIGTTIVIGFLVNYQDPSLAKSGVENIAYSPFTLVFERAGLAVAASFMNAVVLTALLSAGNAGMYLGSRLLCSLAEKNQAPKYFAKINRRGIPLRALNLTAIIAAVCFALTEVGLNTAYYWLMNIAAVPGFAVWFGIAISHYYFRKAYLAQGNRLEDLKFKAKFYPFGPIFACVVCVLIIIGQYYANADFSIVGLFVAYSGLMFIVVLYIGYKVIKKTKRVKPEEADLTFYDDRLIKEKEEA